MVVGGTGLYTYDPATRVKTLRKAYDQQAMGYANNLVYYPPNQRMYFIARGAPTRVWEVTLDRANWANSTVTPMTTTGAVFDSEESGFAYDSWNEVIGGGVANGVFHVFEPELARWSALTMQVQGGGGPVGTQAFHALDFDPVDGVFLFLTGYDSGSRMWAYRYGSGAAVPTLSVDDVDGRGGRRAARTAAVFTARLSQASRAARDGVVRDRERDRDRGQRLPGRVGHGHLPGGHADADGRRERDRGRGRRARRDVRA